MSLERDPRDRRYRERLTGSYLASLLIHTLMALFLFSVVASSSEEGASESQIGGSIVTVQQRAPVVAQAPAKVQPAAPVPHAPRVAPVQHARAAQPAHQPLPPARHELAKFAPTAPPNPTPLPQATPLPNAQPTQATYEPQPQNQLPAVPSSAPTAAAVAVTVTAPPTAAPTPVPTTAPTAKPSPAPPKPTAAPTAKPQTPAPASPSPAPTAVAVVAKATAAPTASPAALPSASSVPAPKPGVPSPSPTQAAAVAQTKGAAPSPGPTGLGSPGPRAGTVGKKAGPSRPVAVNPTPTPTPRTVASAPKPTHEPIDINERLRAMLPHGPVNPTQGSYHPPVTLNGSMEPTPPPEVIAMTKFTYESKGNGDAEHIKMWVTNVRHVGMVTMCDGWMLRFPPATGTGAQRQIGTATSPLSGGVQVSVGAKHVGELAPIVEKSGSAICSERALVPFAPSPAPSP